MAKQGTCKVPQSVTEAVERPEQERQAERVGVFKDPYGSGTVVFWKYEGGVYRLRPEAALRGGWCTFGELLTDALADFRQKLAEEKICAVTWYCEDGKRPGLIVVTEER